MRRRTCSGWQPRRAAARSAVRRALARPWAPVAALALPELITTARMSSAGRSSRHHFTGAAQTRLVVKVPAAAQGPIGRQHGHVERSRRLQARLDATGPEAARNGQGRAVTHEMSTPGDSKNMHGVNSARRPDTTASRQVHGRHRAV